tara:strand:- start:8525 stop:8803 length:279 start_codon:yes stop_codon:yes gene_type:complete
MKNFFSKVKSIIMVVVSKLALAWNSYKSFVAKVHDKLDGFTRSKLQTKVALVSFLSVLTIVLMTLIIPFWVSVCLVTSKVLMLALVGSKVIK